MTVSSPANLSPKPDLDCLLGPDAKRSDEMEALWAWLIEEDARVPNWVTLPPAEARALQNGLAQRWNAVLPEVERVEPITVPGAPDIACQLVTPVGAGPGCLLYLHGGGWAFGTPDTYARLVRLLARAARMRVLVPDYRLAPEHRFPAPLDDCRTAWAWLTGEGRAMLGGGPLVLAGDSAGANLAMSVMLDAGATGGPQPEAALLFYGVYSADLDSPSYRRFGEGFGLTRAGMGRFWDFYAPEIASRTNPLLSPVLADVAALRRLPPLFLNAAGLDPLLCDTLEMSARLRAAGVEHALEIHSGVVHGFMQYSLRLHEATHAIERAAAFLGPLSTGARASL